MQKTSQRCTLQIRQDKNHQIKQVKQELFLILKLIDEISRWFFYQLHIFFLQKENNKGCPVKIPLCVQNLFHLVF